MKLYVSAKESERPIEVSVVTIQASSTELRVLAQFLNACAAELDADLDWEHQHFCDLSDDDGPDVVVCAPA